MATKYANWSPYRSDAGRCLPAGTGVAQGSIERSTVAQTEHLPGYGWWTYFTDTGAAEARLALRTGFAHIPLMLGVVITAAGIHTAVAHPGDPSSWQAALALVGVVVVFLAGIVEIRHSLRTVPVRGRLFTAAAVLATMPIGAEVNAGLHLAAVVAVVVAMLWVDRRYHAAQTPEEA